MREGSEPSIQVALELIDSLLRDIKAESGVDVYSTPLGDESMSTNLARLCRTINRIYESKESEFTRNRERLDEQIEQLRKNEKQLNESAEGIEEKLSILGDVNKNLAAARITHDKISKKYETAVKAKNEYDKILAEIESEEKRINELNGFDNEKAAQKLESLKADRVVLEEKCKEIVGTIKHTEAENKAILAKCEESVKIRNQIAQKYEENRNTLAKLEEETRELTIQNDSNISRVAAFELERKSLAEKIESYRNNALNPLAAEVETLRKEVEALESQRGEKSVNLKKLQDERANCVHDISALSIRCREADSMLKEKQAELSTKKQNLEELNNTYNSLQQDIGNLSGALEEVQNTINETEQKKQELSDLTDSERENLLQLEAEISGFEALQRDNNNQIQKLSEECEANRKTIDALTETKNALTIKFSENNKEIKLLEEQLEDLRGKTDREKLQKYKEQLEDDISAASSVISETAEIEKQLEICEKDLTEKQAYMQELRKRKMHLETADDEIEKIIRELSFVDTPENKAKLENLIGRLQLVSEVRNNLSSAISRVNSALGISTNSSEADTNIKNTLDRLEMTTAALQREIIRMAGSVKIGG